MSVQEKKPKYITLVEKHVITQSDSRYHELDTLCFKSKNLYNRTLYELRQGFFSSYGVPVYKEIVPQLRADDDPDFRALPSKVSAWVVKQACQSMSSFFALLSRNLHPKLPKYLDKTKGRMIVLYPKDAISKRSLQKGIIKVSGADFALKTGVPADLVQFVRIVHRGNHIVIDVGYRYEPDTMPTCHERVAALDMGVNNLAALSSNVAEPLIVNGRPLKAYNQWCNKLSAEKKSELAKKNGVYTSKSLRKLWFDRHNKVRDYLHRASRFITNYLVSNRIDTLIIGHNKGWKQNVNLGAKGNQNFVSIPFNVFIDMLKYKCAMHGIEVVVTEESYTSKCSFIDDEKVYKHKSYNGRRTSRGMFVSASGRQINADLNGSLNILRKGMEHLGCWCNEMREACMQFLNTYMLPKYTMTPHGFVVA